MTNLFDKIKNIKDNFDFNMDDASVDSFPVSKSIMDNFKSIFNVNALAVATLMGLSLTAGAADILPVSTIQASFNDSLKIQNVYYNEKLPTYFENKHKFNTVGQDIPNADIVIKNSMGVDVIFKNTDITLKNEFWKNSIVTLVNNSVDEQSINEIDKKKYQKQIDGLNASFFDSFYVSSHLKSQINQKTADNFYSNKDDYKHYFRNHQNEALKLLLSEKNQKYLDDFITYHEMAHSSYEQEASRIDPHISLSLSTGLGEETHSDISSLLMVANKYALNYDDFKDLTMNLIESRTKNVHLYKDFYHNSSVALVELLHTFDKNKDLYNNMSTDKISAFAAYFVHNVHNQDNAKLIKNMNKQGLTTDVTGFLEAFDEFRNELNRLHSEGKNIMGGDFKMQGAPYFLNIALDAYKQRNPEKYAEMVDALEIGNMEEAVFLQLRTMDEIRNQDAKEKEIFAVVASKIIKNIDFYQYSTYLSSYKKPEFLIESHPVDTISSYLKEHNKEISTTVLKNKTI